MAAPAPLASTVGGSETDVNSVFAAVVSARSRNEADLQFVSSLSQKSSLYEQYMRALEEVKGGPVFERRSDVPSASQAAPAPSSSYVCERTAPNLQFPAPTVPGMPLKPSAAHDPAPIGCVGTFPCQVRYDPRAAPTRAKASTWVESMLGKSHFNPPTSVQESIAAASAQTHVPHDSLRHIPPPQVIPPPPTPGIQPQQSQSFRVSGQDGATRVPNTSGTGSGNPIRPPAGPPHRGGDGWGYIPSQGNPGGGAGPPAGGGGGGGSSGGSGPPNPNPATLLLPDDRAGNAPNPDDVDCERCGCRTTRARARNCVSCRFRCCPNCCRDPLNICRVCAERATGVPPNQAAQNPGGNQGDGGGDRKAKCKPIKLDPEPEPSRLRRWIVDLKEKVANAFSHDIQYAMQWVEIPDDATYDALAAECRYGMLENELNSALRESIKAVALRNKIQAETERMHTLGRRLMSRKILWFMYDHLRPHIAGDNTFKIMELTKMSIDRFTRGCEAERLEAFMDRWDHNLAGITQARPPDDMLCALLYEQVRGMRCLELDMHLWNRDETVRNYAFLRNSIATAVANWRFRDNAERMYPATRSMSPRHAAPAPSPRCSSRSPRSHLPGRGRKKTPPRRNHSSSPKRRFSRDRNKAAPARQGSPKRKS